MRRSTVLHKWLRRTVRGKDIFFFDLCNFTLYDFSLENSCSINWGVPVSSLYIIRVK
jgi:hypothetical protein